MSIQLGQVAIALMKTIPVPEKRNALNDHHSLFNQRKHVCTISIIVLHSMASITDHVAAVT